MVCKSTATRKNKGRMFQKEMVALIQDACSIYNIGVGQYDEIISTSMGNQGKDITLTGIYKEAFPISIEAKNHSVGFAKVYSAFEQAKKNATEEETPVAFVRQNNRKALAVLEAKELLRLYAILHRYAERCAVLRE